jgi:hypothetical protein
MDNGFYERNPAAKGYEGRLVEMHSQEELLRHAFWTIRDWALGYTMEALKEITAKVAAL